MSCPVLFFPLRFARTCSRCSRPPICSPPRRTVCPPARRSTRALDNPTNFFTAASLDNRASDINNLLDSIGNGVQVLQAANTGITSLQKLVDTAKSIAKQVLQAPVGYSTKNSVTSGANAGATSTSLLGATLVQGDVLTIAATGGGTASSITFGTGAAEVDTLTELNAALLANNLQASVDDTTGRITITTTNDAASATIGALGGTATGAGKAFLAASVTTVAKVADAGSQTTRANLVLQYNNIIAQITTTAQDASFNGINLLNGDNLKLTFNETGKSTLNISGVTFNAAGLGLATLVGGTDFLDNVSANATIVKITAAPTRCDRKPRPSVRTCRSCRSARTSPRT